MSFFDDVFVFLDETPREKNCSVALNIKISHAIIDFFSATVRLFSVAHRFSFFYGSMDSFSWERMLVLLESDQLHFSVDEEKESQTKLREGCHLLVYSQMRRLETWSTLSDVELSRRMDIIQRILQVRVNNAVCGEDVQRFRPESITRGRLEAAVQAKIKNFTTNENDRDAVALALSEKLAAIERLYEQLFKREPAQAQPLVYVNNNANVVFPAVAGSVNAMNNLEPNVP